MPTPISVVYEQVTKGEYKRCSKDILRGKGFETRAVAHWKQLIRQLVCVFMSSYIIMLNNMRLKTNLSACRSIHYSRPLIWFHRIREKVFLSHGIRTGFSKNSHRISNLKIWRDAGYGPTSIRDTRRSFFSWWHMGLTSALRRNIRIFTRRLWVCT